MTYLKRSFMDKHFRSIDGWPHISATWATSLVQTTRQTLDNWQKKKPELFIHDDGHIWVDLNCFIEFLKSIFPHIGRHDGQCRGGRGKSRKCFDTGKVITRAKRERCLDRQVRHAEDLKSICPYWEICNALIPSSEIPQNKSSKKNR